tara:strand:- start:24 stop:131 length:108 start_codon:yes stop_codon:yes gene_type:complete
MPFILLRERMLGHVNALLAEASVLKEDVLELDAIN